VHGTVEAVRDALLKLATDTVKVNVILAGVGAISESDVMLAKASDAIVVGFHVRPDSAARRAAEGQGVDLRSYQIIYELTDEVRKAMAGLLPPKIEEKVLGASRSGRPSTCRASGRSRARTSAKASCAAMRAPACCATACRSGRAASRR
jgi:translation initiation factor IF-2